MSVLKLILKKLEIPESKRTTNSVLRNRDLLPIPRTHQTWGFFSNFSYWGLLSFQIGTYSAASSASSIGMSYGNIILAYFVGDIITLLFTIANSYQGINYKVGYTLTQRFVFGIYGSGLGILIRILMSIVNYGSNAFMGAYCVNLMIECIWPQYLNMKNTLSSSVAMSTKELIGFLIFHLLCIFAYYIKPYRINHLLNIASFLCMASFIGLVCYLTHKAGGVGSGFSGSSQTIHGKEFATQFVYMASYWFGSVSPGCVNQSDYSRFCNNQYTMNLGIALGLLIPTTVVPIMGVVGTSAAMKAYNVSAEDVWQPYQICELILNDHYTSKARCGIFFCGLSWTLSQLAYNISSCGVPAGFDASGVLPKYINIYRGAMACAALSFACQPWNFFNTSSTFLTVMSSFGVVMTPILAIMICDNFCIRNQKYSVTQGFVIHGDYYFYKGVNWRAVVVWVIATAPGLPGIYYQIHMPENPTTAQTGIMNYFYANCFTSSLLAFFLYWILCLIWPVQQSIPDDKDYYNAFSTEEARKRNMIPYCELTEEELQNVGMSKQHDDDEDTSSTDVASYDEVKKTEDGVEEENISISSKKTSANNTSEDEAVSNEYGSIKSEGIYNRINKLTNKMKKKLNI